MDFAEACVGPAHEDDRLAVARPTRPQFHRIVFGARQPPRGAAGGGFDPELAERFEPDAAPSGDTSAQRGILVAKLSGATSTVGCVALTMTQTSLITNGMTRSSPQSPFTRPRFPPAQQIRHRLCGSH